MLQFSFVSFIYFKCEMSVKINFVPYSTHKSKQRHVFSFLLISVIFTILKTISHLKNIYWYNFGTLKYCYF